MKRLKNLARQNDGATIIEFAIVAPELLLLLFGIIEFALIMFASSVVEGATTHAARLSKTGALRSTAGTPAAQAQAEGARLRELILDRGAGVLKNDNLNIVTITQSDPSGSMGGSNELVIYNITYNWEVTTPIIGKIIAPDDGIFAITSTVAVVNEPY